MKVKELKEFIKDLNDDFDLNIKSSSGITWNLNKKVQENPKVKDDKVTIFIK